MNRKTRRANAKQGNTNLNATHNGVTNQAIQPVESSNAGAPSALLFQQAFLAYRQGKTEEAIAHCQAVLSNQPTHRDALHLLANIYNQSMRFADAQPIWKKLLTEMPEFAEGWSSLGNCYFGQKNFSAAEESHARALKLKPNDTRIICNYANTLKALNKRAEAELQYQAAIALDPNFCLAHQNYGVLLMEDGLYTKAETHLQTANRLLPNNVAILTNLAFVIFKQGKGEESRAIYEQLTQKEPNDPQHWINFGFTCFASGDTAKAKQAYEKALTFKEFSGLRVRMAIMCEVVIDNKEELENRHSRILEALKALEQQSITLENPELEVGDNTFFLAYYGKSDREVQEAIARLYRKACPKLNFVAPHCSTRALETQRNKPLRRKLRIGFVSDFFRIHTIGKFMRGMIARFDRNAFEIVVCTFQRENDAIRQSIRGCADMDITLSKDVHEACQQVAALELDILFYSDIGMDPITYYMAFSRLAPVQAVTWGHPDTTGISTVDYFLSQKDLELPEADNHYTEQLVRLNHLPTYYFRPPLPERFKLRNELNLPTGRIYLCPQSTFKFHPDFDHTLAEILERDPQGHLVIIQGVHPRWDDRLKARWKPVFGSNFDRVHFLPRVGQDDFLSLLLQADVVLDPPFFGGGNTSYEAFAVGVPIVTWPGNFMRGRVTYGCYKQMGIEDLIATSSKHYVELALKLGNDGQFKQQMRDLISERCNVLFEDIGAVREIEQFFYAAYKAVLDGKKIDGSTIGAGNFSPEDSTYTPSNTLTQTAAPGASTPSVNATALPQPVIERYQQAMNAYKAGRFDEGTQLMRTLVNDVPEEAIFTPIRMDLVTILEEQGHTEEARALCESVWNSTQFPAAAIRLATMVQPIPLSEAEMIADYVSMVPQIEALQFEGITLENPIREGCQIPFYTVYHGENERPLQEALARLYLQSCPNLAYVAPHCKPGTPYANLRPARQKIKIGFLSHYFENHVIQLLTEGLIAHWPRDVFETVLIRTRPASGEAGEALNRLCDRVVHLPNALAATQQILAQEALDILFFCDIGMDPFTYFLAFGRYAPLQCTSWGHPVTTGLPTMDYFLSSAALETEESDSHYSETLVRLPELPACYSPIPEPDHTRTVLDFGLIPDAHYYLCPQTLFKFHPEFDAILADILQRDPKAVLIALEGRYPHWTERLKARWEKTFPMHRVAFLPYMPREHLLRLIELSHVMLDPIHFGGGNTTYEGLSLGTPIVTWPGRFMRGRVTAGCYQRMGITGLTANSAETYAALAVEIASNPAKRAALKAEILSKNAAIIGNTQAAASMAETLKQLFESKTGVRITPSEPGQNTEKNSASPSLPNATSGAQTPQNAADWLAAVPSFSARRS